MGKSVIVGRLEVEPIRKAFPNEAHDFTTWLEGHLDTLGERIGLELSPIQREKSVGAFNVDLLCEDNEGRRVIVENQLENTDHKHMGQLLTYLVNLDAQVAIWVTTDARPEHQRVIDWLNEVAAETAAFYLVKVEAIRIGDSPLAPLFTVLARPDEQAKEIGESKKEWAERHHLRFEFWKALLEKSRERTKLFSTISPSRNHWISNGAGRSGISFNYVIHRDHGTAELYIDNDQETGEGNKRIFDALHAHRAEIEKEFGGELDWERLDGKRASRIAKRFSDAGLATPESWPKLQDQMIETMIRLEKVLKPRLMKVET